MRDVDRKLEEKEARLKAACAEQETLRARIAEIDKERERINAEIQMLQNVCQHMGCKNPAAKVWVDDDEEVNITCSTSTCNKRLCDRHSWGCYGDECDSPDWRCPDCGVKCKRCRQTWCHSETCRVCGLECAPPYHGEGCIITCEYCGETDICNECAVENKDEKYCHKECLVKRRQEVILTMGGANPARRHRLLPLDSSEPPALETVMEQCIAFIESTDVPDTKEFKEKYAEWKSKKITETEFWEYVVDDIKTEMTFAGGGEDKIERAKDLLKIIRLYRSGGGPGIRDLPNEMIERVLKEHNTDCMLTF